MPSVVSCEPLEYEIYAGRIPDSIDDAVAIDVRLGPRGGIDEVATLPGVLDHIAVEGGVFWLRSDSALVRWSPDEGATQITFDEEAQYELGRESMGLAVDSGHNLYIGCFYLGVFRIDPNGRVCLAIPMDHGAHSVALGPDRKLYVASNLCVIIRTEHRLELPGLRRRLGSGNDRKRSDSQSRGAVPQTHSTRVTGPS